MLLSRRTRRKINKAFTSVLKLLQIVFSRRFAALALCLVMLIGVLPAQAFAIDWKDLSMTKATGPNSADAGSDQEQNGTHIAGKNYYVLEVSSGTRLGGGYADNVLYFAVQYTDVNGTQRTAIIMPGLDGVSTGNQVAHDISNQERRRQMVNDLFGYTTEDLINRKALGSVTSDQLLFEAPFKVSTIDKIQIFGKKSATASVWPCQGMRVYEVSDIYGLDMYGWYSEQSFIDFSGTVIAEAVMAPGGGNFTWQTSGGTFNITPMNGSTPKDITLVRTTDKEQFESTFNKTTNVGRTVRSAETAPVVIRMDFADQAGSGFESMTAFYDLGAQPKLKDMAMCEAAALTVRYMDVFGDQRDVVLPLIVNSLGSAADVLGSDISIAGYALQGDSIAIPALLPHFASIVSTKLIIGEKAATEAAGLKVDAGVAANAKYKTRAALTETDDIDYTCLALYTDVDVRIGLDEALIRYSFDAGKRNPVSYSSANSTSGLPIPANKSTTISMNDYNDRVVLEPKDNQIKFLVTLCTDNVENSGTAGDLLIQFKYINIKEKETTSPMYHVRDYVNDFYGSWPANSDDFAYVYTMRDGGTAQFIVPIQDVKEFTGVSFKLEGEDEWQFSGLTIAKVEDVSDRTAVWTELKGTRSDINNNILDYSHLLMGRNVQASAPLFRLGVVYQEGEDRPAAGSDNWKPGTLIQDDDNTSEFNGKGEIVDKVDEIDWSEILHYMTYDQAIGDLKFTKQRCNYKVTVSVAGDKVNTDDEDCGSKNLFYFQLIFENGNSGCMLANQQIEGDAFRTGSDTEFYIPCAQDYGDLLAVQIIPDDQDGNSDIYDKMKIKSINVEKMTDDFICPTWAATSSSGEDLGWVGIDYRDPGEVASNKGAEGRTVSEVATTYQINESSYNAKFLFSIKTGAYGSSPRQDEGGRTYYVNDPIYRGGMTMTYSYFDRDGVVKNKDVPIDIVKLMNEYAARRGAHQRNTELDEENYEVDYFVSDPAYNFRPGRTDNFYMTIENISQFTKMALQLRSDVATHWNVSEVKIYLVNGQGLRYLNARGEYDYKYPEGKEPTLVAEWSREGGMTADCKIYRHKQGTNIQEIPNMNLECEPINLNPEAIGWTSIISREPKSKNDTFNLFIYPEPATGDIAKPGTYNLKAAVQYTNALTLKPSQTSAGTLRTGYDEAGNLCYYALGLDAKNLDSITGVPVETNSMKPINVPIERGVLQVVRSGVLIDSYDLGGATNADGGDYMSVRDFVVAGRRSQKLILQLSDDTRSQLLAADKSDLAVALHFIPDDPSGQELRSKYIYLTDAGYTTATGGQVYEIDFDLGNLKDITGVNIVSIGNLEATVEGVSAYEFTQDGTITNTFSANGPFTPTGRASRIDSGDQMTPLTLQITTALDDGTVSSSATGPVRMTVGYYDSYGVLRQDVYEDITRYVVNESSSKVLQAGNTDTVRLLVRGMSELRWIEFEPVSDASTPAGKIQTWKLGSVSAETGMSGSVTTRTPSQLIVEGNPLHISFADVIMTGVATVTDTTGTAISTYSVISGGSTSVLLARNNGLNIDNTVFGSNEGIDVKLESYDPSSGATANVRLGTTYSYSSEYLNATLQSAEDSATHPGSEAERLAAERVISVIKEMKESSGDLIYKANGFVFKAPVNYTGRDLYYRLTVSSRELPDVYYTVDVTVYPAADELAGAVQTWNNEQAAARNSSSGINTSGAAQTGGQDQTQTQTQNDTTTPAAVNTSPAAVSSGPAIEGGN